MKKTLKTLMVMVATAAIAFAGDVVDQEQAGVPIVVETSYASDKVWRGDDLGQNDATAEVSTVVELPAEIVLDLTAQYGYADSSTEADEATELAAAFSKNVADYLVSLSYTWYSEGFDSAGDNSAQEIGLSVSRAVGPVYLTLTQYLATQGDNGGYSELKAVYSDDFGALPVILDFTGELGYLSQDTKFTHFEAKISTDIPVLENVLAQPFVAYNLELGESFAAGTPNNVFFGGVQFKRVF